MPLSKSTKMIQYINFRIRVAIQDGRTLVGTFLAFDKHMNLVLADCEEWRRVRQRRASGHTVEKDQKRSLGLVLLRGENVVSLQVEAPPPQSLKKPSAGRQQGGHGVARSAGRGVAAAPPPAAMGALSGMPRGMPGMMPGMGMPPPPPGAGFGSECLWRLC